MLDIELVFFNQLNERQKRLYVGLKSIELGYHGVRKIADEFGVHPHTIRLGQKELQDPNLSLPKRIRKAGGGRKKK